MGQTDQIEEGTLEPPSPTPPPTEDMIDVPVPPVEIESDIPF